MKPANRKSKRPTVSDREHEDKNRVRNNQKAAEMIRQWMATDDGYDERVWPILEAELRRDPIRHHDPDDSGP